MSEEEKNEHQDDANDGGSDDSVTDEQVQEYLDKEAKDESGESKPDADPRAGLSEKERKWLELEKHGVTPEQMLDYANVGYLERHKKKETSSDESGADKDASEPSPDDMVSRAEMEAVLETKVRELQSQMHIGDASTINAVKLDGMLEADETLSRHPRLRDIVQSDTIKKAAEGVPLAKAFKEARDEIQTLVSSVAREVISRKIANSKATGATPAVAASVDDAPEAPTHEHKASDFADGSALKQALAFARMHDR